MAVIKYSRFLIERGDFASAGLASGSIKRALKALGINSAIVRMIAIASYEAELNMIIHSQGGEIILEVEETSIRVIFRDNGPGIPDIEKAMEEGYSTASDDVRNMGFGAGMGLPNIKRNSHRFSISSAAETGTEIIVSYRLNG